MLTVTEKHTNCCDCLHVLAVVTCRKLLPKRPKNENRKYICKHYLNQVWCREEGNIDCGVFFPKR